MGPNAPAFGATQGLVTLEDVIEELVGDIDDEFDARNPNEFITDGDNVRVAGTYPLHALRDRLKLSDAVDIEDVDTIGGYITQELGRWPRTGDSVELGTYEAHVLSTQQKQVRQVLLMPIVEEKLPKPKDGSIKPSATPTSNGSAKSG